MLKAVKSYKNLMRSAAVLTLAAVLAGCGGAGGVVDRFTTDDEERAEKRKKQASSRPTGPLDDRRQILTELQALRAELERRGVDLESDLAAARRELARRQGRGEISADQANLSPSQIRDSQVSELELLKAELARRQEAGERKKEVIATSLTENEPIYKHVDTCLTRGSDFRNAFDGRPELTALVKEKNNQVYQNEDRSLLILTSKDRCDISFAGSNIDDYTTGLVHILEQQGGVVETKKLANITIVSVAHPRGEFRLTNGRKVIGQGGSTNFYTTISAL